MLNPYFFAFEIVYILSYIYVINITYISCKFVN